MRRGPGGRDKPRSDDFPHKLPISPDEFAQLLLTWYAQNRRALPWRQHPEAYRVWVAEVMLQQTTVKTVAPYFEAFLKAFPDVFSLARAEEAAVLARWAGLGYYNRARHLLETARRLVLLHGGAFPADYSTALALPGIGRYTAGAVLSIAYGLPFPVLDGNVKRLFVRYLAFQGPWNHAASRSLWELLANLVRNVSVRDQVADFNQGLMELGATVCTPTRAHCSICPVSATCRGRLLGIQDLLPRESPKRPLVVVDFTAAVIDNAQGILMTPGAGPPFPKDFWELPRISGVPGSAAAARFLAEHDLRIEIVGTLGTVLHGITHHRLRIHLADARLLAAPPTRFRWINPNADDVAVSSYVRKAVSLMRAG